MNHNTIERERESSQDKYHCLGFLLGWIWMLNLEEARLSQLSQGAELSEHRPADWRGSGRWVYVTIILNSGVQKFLSSKTSNATKNGTDDNPAPQAS